MNAKTVGAEQDQVRDNLTYGMRPAQREAIIAAAVANANAAPIQVTPEVTRRLSELLGVALELPVDDD